MRASKIGCALLLVIAMLLLTERARADDVDPREPTFRYTAPAKRYWLRGTLEELLVLGGGYAQYVQNKEANVGDFDNTPDWGTLKSKVLLGSALTFDNNLFDTNWLTHPLAGWFYYGVARSNRLSIPVSVGYAFLSSMIWEVLGEIREDAAINDVIATPLSGISLAEPMLQTGALFQRARRTPATIALGWLFAPMKSLHDAIDGLHPEQASEVDDLGLPLDEWHRIRLGGSAGITQQQRGAARGDARFFGESRIVALPHYGRDGKRSGWFDAGEVTELRLHVGVSEGHLVDLEIAAHMLPFGYRAQDVHRDHDGRLRGDELFAGLHVGTEYGRHDYDRDRRRGADRLALVSLGSTVEETIHAGPFLVRARLDVLATFGGVDAYALPEYDARHGRDSVTSVLRNQGYYHAYGGTLRPRLDVEAGRFDSGVDLRADWFEQITGRDRGGGATPLDVAATDRRLGLRTSLGFRPTPHIRLSLLGEARQRMGRIDDVRSARAEVGMHGGVESVF